ncbi:uncharacterized protein B4U80_01558 [Leptotrombidium deliense]|uniref:Uncharacterized protein n=1 Tax=Leptotrombidium deliense TaxID=299467 RepID=A0A443R661_9ACAR|nr:uncharacterized protein B4U80_01558 [Leptotrombidium deliense]
MFISIVFIALVVLVAGHGMLIDPPSRSSAWRFGFKTPINYNDNELFCGGFLVSLLTYSIRKV